LEIGLALTKYYGMILCGKSKILKKKGKENFKQIIKFKLEFL